MQIEFRGKVLGVPHAALEAYAQLMNAQPVAVVAAGRSFIVGHVDSNLRLHEFRRFETRTEALREFAMLCRQWADK